MHHPQMKGDKERVLECTTSAFDGLIAMVNPQDSWVVSSPFDGSNIQQNMAKYGVYRPQARYQRIGRLALLLTALQDS